MSVKKALAGLPLVLNACGGGDGDSGPDYTPNEPGQGIWKGGFSAEPITVSGGSGAIPADELEQFTQIGLGVFTSSTSPNNNRAFFYNEGSDILFANDAPGVTTVGSTHNLQYAPDIYIAGNRTGSVTFEGNPVISSRINGIYGTSITGNYAMNFDQQYFESANLNQFSGVWTYTNSSTGYVWTLDFDCSDTICNTAGGFNFVENGVDSCAGRGGLSMIGDGSKNEYNLSVRLESCGNSAFSGVSGTNYYGVAAVIDGTSSNDTLLMGFTSTDGDHGFFVKAVKN